MRFILVATVPLSIVVTLAYFGVYTFINGYVINELHLSNAKWTQMMLFFSGGMVLGQLTGAELTRKFGRRTVLISFSLLTGLSFCTLAHFAHPIIVVIALVLLSLNAVTPAIVWFPFVAEYGRDKPAKAMALSNTVATLMGTLTIMAGAHLLTLCGYQKGLLVMGIVSIICTLVFAFISGEMKNEDHQKLISLFRLKGDDIRSLLRGSFVWILIFGVCVEPFSFHTANQLYPNLTRDIHGFSEENIGMIVALGRIPALLVLFALSSFIDGRNIPRIYSFGVMLAATGIACAGFAQGDLFVVVAYFMYYLGQGTIWASNTASINSCIDPKLRDCAFAIMGIVMSACVFLVGSFHSVLLGLEKTLPTTFIYCAIISITGGFLLFLRTFGKGMSKVT